MKSNKLLHRILIPAYIQFAACIVFWGAVGFEAIRIKIIGAAGAYTLVALLTFTSVVVILAALSVDRFYYQNIHESIENLEKLNLKLRTQRHEYLNEMQVVYGLLELGEYDEAVKYLKPIYNDIAKVGKALKTAKPAVNALLQTKLESAKKLDVEFFIEVSSDIAYINIEQWELCKVLANLLDNAFAAVSDNVDKAREVHISISENEACYIFCVYNNGPEIPENRKMLIFKQGFTTKNEEGHGLGLSLVKRIVEAHSGKITVLSSKEKTSFTVEFPK